MSYYDTPDFKQQHLSMIFQCILVKTKLSNIINFQPTKNQQ